MFPTFKNIDAFFKSRPPMVIFFICLATLTVVTFSFAFYIAHTDKIVDSDSKQNWASLARYMNALDLCVTNKKSRFLDETSFYASIRANLTQLPLDNNATTVTASYDLRSWQPHCSDGTAQTEAPFATVTFDTSGDLGDRVCALVRLPRGYLAGSHAHSCDFGPARMSGLALSSCGRDDANLTSLKLLFDEYETFETTYLSLDDRRLIYVHLMWCGCVLAFGVLIILASAVFHSPDYMYLTNKTFEN